MLNIIYNFIVLQLVTINLGILYGQIFKYLHVYPEIYLCVTVNEPDCIFGINKWLVFVLKISIKQLL